MMGFFEKGKLTKENLMKKENMAVIALIGVLILVIAIPVDKKEKQEKDAERNSLQGENFTTEGAQNIDGTSQELLYAESLEKRVEEILSCMEGVGNVKVMITLKTSKELVVEKDSPSSRNSIVENDANGGNRSTSEYQDQEATIYTTDENGNKIPYVIKTKEPEIEGVTVVAEGGNNAIIQKNISEVIQALFHIEVHKIKVVKMK